MTAPEAAAAQPPQEAPERVPAAPPAPEAAPEGREALALTPALARAVLGFLERTTLHPPEIMVFLHLRMVLEGIAAKPE